MYKSLEYSSHNSHVKHKLTCLDSSVVLAFWQFECCEIVLEIKCSRFIHCWCCCRRCRCQIDMGSGRRVRFTLSLIKVESIYYMGLSQVDATKWTSEEVLFHHLIFSFSLSRLFVSLLSARSCVCVCVCLYMSQRLY